MKTEDLILDSINAHASICELIDEYCENFNIDIHEDEIFESLELDKKNVGNALLDNLFRKIQSKYVHEYNLNEELFCWYVNALDSHFYFDETEIFNKEELENAINEYLNE